MRTTAAVPVWHTTHIDPVLFEPLAAAALAVVADADAVGAAEAAGLRGGGAYAEYCEALMTLVVAPGPVADGAVEGVAEVEIVVPVVVVGAAKALEGPLEELEAAVDVLEGVELCAMACVRPQ